MRVPGDALVVLGELETGRTAPPMDDRGAYRLGVVSAVDFTARPPTLTIGEGEFARPMRFVGSVSQYNTGQMVAWLEQPGAPLVIGPVPIVGADPADPESLEPYHVIGAAGEPAFQNGWVWWGAPQSTPAFYKQNDGWVRLKGSVKNGSSTTAVIFTLPTGYRPPFDVYVSTISAGLGAQITIATDGTVQVADGGGTSHVSLDGITFPTAWNQPAWKFPRLQNGWGWNPLQFGSVPEVFVRDDGWCWQKGSINNGTAPAVWSEYPPECYARGSGFIFTCFVSEVAASYAGQVDLHYSGEGVYRPSLSRATVVGNLAWFGSQSIGVVTFTTASLQNGWTSSISTSDTPVRPNVPGYYKDHFGVVHLRGAANGAAKSSDTIFTLPVGYRPAQDHLFLARDGGDIAIARVDVRANGTVARVVGELNPPVFSLAHVSFRAEQ